MLALLSQAFLAEEGHAPADCLILNNPPYSFEEYHRWLDRIALRGLRIQSTRARAETFKAIVNYVTAERPPLVPFERLKGTSLMGADWEPSGDRDNRRKVYLYFSPDDRTVGMSSPHGIGWQGVPEEKRCRVAGQDRQYRLLPELGSRFFQRVFTARVREGKPALVGDAPGVYTIWAEGETFWGQDLPWLKRALVMAKPDKDARRRITGEPLPEPFPPDLGASLLTVTPVDAATAVTNDGRDHGMSGDGQDKTQRPLKTEDIPDPRPHPPLGWGQDELGRGEVSEVEQLLNQGKGEPDQVTILHAWRKTGGLLTVQRHETYNEARARWQHEQCANSYHSGIVANPEHSRKAHAYDLAIGWTSISKEEYDNDRHDENWKFMKYLWAIADWRYKNLGPIESAEHKGRVFAEDDLADESIRSILQINADYYATGILSPEIVNCPLPKTCVMSETVREEELGREDDPASQPLPAQVRVNL